MRILLVVFVPSMALQSVESTFVASLSRLLREEVGTDKDVDWAGVSATVAKYARGSHKDWARTRQAARELAGVLPAVDDSKFRAMFRRVLDDGGWDRAPPQHKPWVVLVAGLNGIRKTTALYEPWMATVLAEAGIEDAPVGANSFFRQLDFLMATIANQDFALLYRQDDVAEYARQKADIFARFRTAAEMCGVLLLEAAKKRRKNVMVETSGRDVGMFTYVDYFFDDDDYRKLVIYFDINDVEFAKTSVDARMRAEMRQGKQAMRFAARDIVNANAGGPYGPDVLDGVNDDARRVWATEVETGNVGATWHKVRVAITASDDKQPWTAAAAGGKSIFEFTPKP